MLVLGDVATWVSGIATTAAVGFAAIQLLELRRDALKRQRVELEGVAVSWRAYEVPTKPDTDGNSTAKYEIIAHNPGSLSITQVNVTLTFLKPVQRVHVDGTLESSTSILRLDTPVIAGGDKRSWDRLFKLSFADRKSMRGIQADIEFRSLIDARTHRNHWGKDTTSF